MLVSVGIHNLGTNCSQEYSTSLLMAMTGATLFSGVPVAATHSQPMRATGYVAFLRLLQPADNFVVEGITLSACF